MIVVVVVRVYRLRAPLPAPQGVSPVMRLEVGERDVICIYIYICKHIHVYVCIYIYICRRSLAAG